jgi:hypothetical protein
MLVVWLKLMVPSMHIYMQMVALAERAEPAAWAGGQCLLLQALGLAM